MTWDSRCGTYAGYQVHRRKGEPPCPSCRAANTERSHRNDQRYLEKHGHRRNRQGRKT